MSKANKVLLKQFFITGSIFALMMAGFNYIMEDNFQIWRFLFHFISFGLTMGFLARKNLKNQIPTKDYPIK